MKFKEQHDLLAVWKYLICQTLGDMGCVYSQLFNNKPDISWYHLEASLLQTKNVSHFYKNETIKYRLTNKTRIIKFVTSYFKTVSDRMTNFVSIELNFLPCSSAF